MATSVTYPSGISFTFDADYAVGQFINGDYYVVAPSGLDIDTMTPTYTAGRNGYEVNPTRTGGQSFDDRAGGTFTAPSALPLTVSVGSSVVKTESVVTETDGSFVQTAEVLTVLASAPSAGSFRPPYFHTSKPITNISSIVTTSLGQLNAALVSTTIGNWTFQDVADRFVSVQMDHLTNFIGRSIHPVDSMPGYGGAVSRDNGATALRFTLDDFDYAGTQSHKDALHNYIQFGIDLKAIIDNGGSFPANGGHGEGRKMPILFAGKILNDSAYATTVAGGTFGESQHLYRSSVTGEVLFGIEATETQYWRKIDSNNVNGSADARDPYQYIDAGSYSVGLGISYQSCCTFAGWAYEATLIHVLDLRTEFGHADFFEYVDRYMTLGVITLPDPLAPYAGDSDDTLANYGITWGGDIGSEVLGAGRWPLRDGDQAGTYGYADVFGDDMYANFFVQSDVVAPILTLPTGIQTSSTTATGTVTTDEGSKTLYFLATENATETAATIKAGLNQIVFTAELQDVSFTDLTPNTTYYIHYVQDDSSANESNVVHSASFTTEATTVVSLFDPTHAVVINATSLVSGDVIDANGAPYDDAAEVFWATDTTNGATPYAKEIINGVSQLARQDIDESGIAYLAPITGLDPDTNAWWFMASYNVIAAPSTSGVAILSLANAVRDGGSSFNLTSESTTLLHHWIAGAWRFIGTPVSVGTQHFVIYKYDGTGTHDYYDSEYGSWRQVTGVAGTNGNATSRFLLGTGWTAELPSSFEYFVGAIGYAPSFAELESLVADPYQVFLSGDTPADSNFSNLISKLGINLASPLVSGLNEG